MYREQIEAYFRDKEALLVDYISRLVSIRSVKGDPAPGAPFGPGPAAALDEALKLCAELGFATENHQGYVGTADLGEGDTLLHILGHLDVVNEGSGWTVTQPYAPKLVDGMLYGRGTDDDKGPVVCAMLAMKAVRDLNIPLKGKVRLLMGTDEESGSEDIAWYYSRNPYAPYTFSPDADFPLINIEKGHYHPVFTQSWEATDLTPRVTAITGSERTNVVPSAASAVVVGMAPPALSSYLTHAAQETGVSFTAQAQPDGSTVIHAAGVGGHAAEPEKANNALTALMTLLAALPLANCPSTHAVARLHALFPHGDWHGKALGVAQSDGESGKLTLAFTKMDWTETGCAAQFDSRTPLCANEENCKAVAERALGDAGFTVEGGMTPPHHVPASSPFVSTLLDCYTAYTGAADPKPIAIGGGTYVHDIPGGVAFGCAMPGFVSNLHGPDEHACVADLLTSCKIFALAIARLCGA